MVLFMDKEQIIEMENNMIKYCKIPKNKHL